MNNGALCKILEPLAAHIPGQRHCDDKGYEEDLCITTCQQSHNLFLGGTEDLADTNLLATIFRLEHCQAEHADECDDETNDAEDNHLANEAELILIESLHLLVEEMNLHGASIPHPREFVLYLSAQG